MHASSLKRIRDCECMHKPLQVEAQVPRVKPYSERAWSYSAALTAQQATDLPIQMQLLGSAAAELTPPSIGQLHWSQRVYGTKNFWRAVRLPPGEAPNSYLRQMASLLALPGGDMVLLSEREADEVLCLMWQHQGAGGSVGGGQETAPVLLSLCYAHAACGDEGSVSGGGYAPLLAHTARGRPAGGVALEAGQLASLLVLDGETSYQPALHAALGQLVQRRKAEVAELLAARGKEVLLSRSDLEAACDGFLSAGRPPRAGSRPRAMLVPRARLACAARRAVYKGSCFTGKAGVRM